MMTWRISVSPLLILIVLVTQTPTHAPSKPLSSDRLVASAPTPAAVITPANDLPSAPLRAQYSWGYLGDDGEGKGTFSVLVNSSDGRVVLELHGLGERLMLLEGNSLSGYRVQIPRQKLDQTVSSLSELPLPFLPQIGTVEALRALILDGKGPGVKVTKKDPKGPLKLKYDGKDDRGKDVQVWLERTRIE